MNIRNQTNNGYSALQSSDAMQYAGGCCSCSCSCSCTCSCASTTNLD